MMIATKKRTVSEWLSELSLPIMLVILIVFFSIASPYFFKPTNLTNIFVQNVHVVIVATATLIIMVSGGCDLSVGYQMSVAAVLCGKMISTWGINSAVASICAILLCSLLGTFNGYISYKLKSHVMIVTLGTMTIFKGISYLISGSKKFNNLPDGFKMLGQGRLWGWLPINVIVMVVVVLIVGFILEKTSIGRKVYAAGDNPEAGRLAGLDVNKIKVLSFTCAGLLVGLAAVLLAARSGSTDSSTGVGIEFTGITACVLSGVALKGGEGTLWKVIVAVYILGVLSNGMQLINLGAYPQYIATGLIMLVSLYLSNRAQKTA